MTVYGGEGDVPNYEQLDGNQIASRRKARGLTQAALAEKAGVNITTIFRWESGAVLPSLPYLHLLHEILSGFEEGVSPLDELILEQASAIALINRDSVYIAANDLFANRVGRHRDDIVDAPVLHIIPELQKASHFVFGLSLEAVIRRRTKRFELRTSGLHLTDEKMLNRFDLVAEHGYIARHVQEIRRG